MIERERERVDLKGWKRREREQKKKKGGGGECNEGGRKKLSRWVIIIIIIIIIIIMNIYEAHKSKKGCRGRGVSCEYCFFICPRKMQNVFSGTDLQRQLYLSPHWG